MVSIFAETVVDATDTVSLNDGERFNIQENFSFGPISVDTTIGGFVYMEKIIANIDFSPDIGVLGGSNNEQFKLRSTVEYDYDGTIDLFSDVPRLVHYDEFIASGNNEIVSGPFSVEQTLDIYLDVPADISLDFAWDDGNRVFVDGNQTVTADLDVILVGRKP